MANSYIVNNQTHMVPSPGKSHTQVAVQDSVVTLSASITPGDATQFMMISPLADGIRYTLDGSDPSATKGFLWEQDKTYIITVDQWNVAKAIREASTNTTLETQECGNR